MSNQLTCSTCKRQTLTSNVEGWYKDALSNVFCTNACASGCVKATCVPVFGFPELVERSKLHSVFFTDSNFQMATFKMVRGDKIGDEENRDKPDLHLNATQTILIFSGSLKVTVYRDDIPYSVELSASGINQIMVIPCNTPHLMENVNDDMAIGLLLYAPPVH